MKLKRYIRSANALGPLPELELDFKKQLKANFGGSTARRMTDLALLIGEVTKNHEFGIDDTVIYATTFSESRCLEKYLESFPNPSPLGFQNSIHPSGLEQVMIARKQPLNEFIPLAGREEISGSALHAAFTSPKKTQWLVVAEEKSTWLSDIKFASQSFFAAVLELSVEPENAIGELSLEKIFEESPSEVGENLLNLHCIVSERRNTDLISSGFGKFAFRWA